MVGEKVVVLLRSDESLEVELDWGFFLDLWVFLGDFGWVGVLGFGILYFVDFGVR